MGLKSKDKFLLYTLFCGISCTHSATSQHVNNVHTPKRPVVLVNSAAYHNSIRHNDNKRIVALKNYITPLFTEWKYAETGNFTGQILYKNPAAYARKPVAEALKAVQEELAEKKLSLKFFDAYRPYSVTEKMWKIVPDERYAANPAKGSGHNRGIAVDVTLAKLATGEELEMPTAFDDFTEKAHHNYMQLSREIIDNRALLKTIMEKNGFTALSTEWWHYSFSNSGEQFELLDLDFKLLKKITGTN